MEIVSTKIKAREESLFPPGAARSRGRECREILANSRRGEYYWKSIRVCENSKCFRLIGIDCHLKGIFGNMAERFLHTDATELVKFFRYVPKRSYGDRAYPARGVFLSGAARIHSIRTTRASYLKVIFKVRCEYEEFVL